MTLPTQFSQISEEIGRHNIPFLMDALLSDLLQSHLSRYLTNCLYIIYLWLSLGIKTLIPVSAVATNSDFRIDRMINKYFALREDFFVLFD